MSSMELTALEELQDTCRQGLQFLLNYMFANAEQALLGQAGLARTNAEQNLYFEAMRELRFKRRGVEVGFLDGATSSFWNLFSDTSAAQPSDGMPGEIDLDELSLVQTQALEDELNIESMVDHVDADALKLLERLSAGFAELLAIRNLNIEDNPVAPKNLATIYVGVCDKLEVNQQSKEIFCRLFERLVLGQIDSFYQQLLDALPEAATIDETSLEEEITQTGVLDDVLNETSLQTSQDVEPEDKPVLVASRSKLSGGWDTNQCSLLADPGNAPAMPKILLDELLEGAQGQLLNRKHAALLLNPRQLSMPLDIPVLLQEQLEILQYARAQAMPFEYSDTISKVYDLVSELLSDSRLPPAIQRIIKMLQLPLLRAALKDSALLEQLDNPATKLIALIPEMALANENKVIDATSPLVKRLDEIATSVVQNFAGDLEVFAIALEELQSWKTAAAGKELLVEARSANAEIGREKAEAARIMVRGLIAEHLSAVQVPPVLRELLTGPWSDVVYVVLLQYGQNSQRWDRVTHLTQCLIESVQKPVSQDECDQRAEELPGLMQAVREHFGAIRQGSERSEELVARLEKIQSLLLKLASADPVDRAAQTDDEPNTETAPQETAPQETGAPEHVLQQVDKMAPDTWIEFRVGGKTSSGRLLTRIPVTGKLLFVNSSGGKEGEWGRDELALALHKGKAVVQGCNGYGSRM